MLQDLRCLIMNHAITIESPRNGSTFQNDLILCVGRIKNKPNSCATPNHLLINSVVQVNVNPQTHTFRCLVGLQPGPNSITFSYCCVTTVITVQYRPRLSDVCVVPLYIICKDHDGHFQAPDDVDNSAESACRRITLGCRLLQLALASKLHDCKTFVIDTKGCVVFRSKLLTKDAYLMSRVDLWRCFAREIIVSGVGSMDAKYVAFLGCTKYRGCFGSKDHDAFVASTDGYVAYGGEALALLGSGCLYTWPERLSDVLQHFEDEGRVDTAKFLDDSFYRGTKGGCFATTLGATLHELCHTFDLGHDIEGIMGHGFNNIQQIFLDDSSHSKPNDAFFKKNQLMLLNYHRWFNDYSDDGHVYMLEYDATSRFVKSTAGIRVVELRQGANEDVIAHWVFDGRVLKYWFQVNHAISGNDASITVLVEDNRGSILKRLFV